MADLSRRVFLILGALTATAAARRKLPPPTGGLYSNTYSDTY